MNESGRREPTADELPPPTARGRRLRPGLIRPAVIAVAAAGLALGLAAVVVALLPAIRAKRKEVFVEDD